MTDCERCGHGPEDHSPHQEADFNDPCNVRGCACCGFMPLRVPYTNLCSIDEAAGIERGPDGLPIRLHFS